MDEMLPGTLLSAALFRTAPESPAVAKAIDTEIASTAPPCSCSG